MTLLGAPGVATRQGYLGHKNAPILKHVSTSPPLFHKALFKCARFFKGVITVLSAEWGDFYVINWRNTLEKPANHLRGFGK